MNNNPILSYPAISSFIAMIWGWVALNGKVFDLTEFMDRHPGGPTTILAWAGILATILMWSCSVLFALAHCIPFPRWIYNILQLQRLSGKTWRGIKQCTECSQPTTFQIIQHVWPPTVTNQIRQSQVHAVFDSSHEMLRKDASKFFNEIHKGGICLILEYLSFEIGQRIERSWV